MKILRKVRTPTTYTQSEILRYAPPAQRQQLLRLAKQLNGKRVVHVNATATGGGVAEILKSFVPYLRGLGVNSDWYSIQPKSVPKKFFSFTNRLHNALQGIPVRFSAMDWRRYQTISQQIELELERLKADLFVIHDPQPLLAGTGKNLKQPKIVFMHIDTTRPDAAAWKRILPLFRAYSQVVFSNRDFVHDSLPKQKLRIIPPAIDPLALKQKIVPQTRARHYLSRYKLPTKSPLVIQVSRFDVWKNPLGLVEAHHLVRQAVPNVHSVFVGLKEAKDNPEADRVYRDLIRASQEHLSIHFFFHPWGIQSIPEFTMMAQNAADVIVQNSIREGFGLTVTEAMWKGKPVIGGPASGIKKQIRNGKNGIIAKDSEALAKAIILLLQRPALRKRLGRAARRSVQEHFLMSRLVRDHLRIYDKVLRRR